MADNSAIEWTDATWNPLRGCSRVSAGCQHCYAERVAARFSGPGMPYEWLIHPATKGWNGKVRFVTGVLDQPMRWKRPRRIFVNSMSDLFHESVPFEVIATIFAVMASCISRRHTFQILTKRPQRMLEFFAWLEAGSVGANHRYMNTPDYLDGVQARAELPRLADGRAPLSEPPAPTEILRYLYDIADPVVSTQTSMANGLPEHHWQQWPLRNVWLGVSVENQATADERIPLLLQCPAAVRWLSCEPLLAPVSLYGFVSANGRCLNSAGCTPSIDWVVAGGESGTGARPMHPDWARSLRDQCASAAVPFFFKQWGEWAPGGELCKEEWCWGGGIKSVRIGKKAAGRLLDGVEHNAYPEAR